MKKTSVRVGFENRWGRQREGVCAVQLQRVCRWTYSRPVPQLLVRSATWLFTLKNGKQKKFAGAAEEWFLFRRMHLPVLE